MKDLESESEVHEEGEPPLSHCALEGETSAELLAVEVLDLDTEAEEVGMIEGVVVRVVGLSVAPGLAVPKPVETLGEAVDDRDANTETLTIEGVSVREGLGDSVGIELTLEDGEGLNGAEMESDADGEGEVP